MNDVDVIVTIPLDLPRNIQNKRERSQQSSFPNPTPALMPMPAVCPGFCDSETRVGSD